MKNINYKKFGRPIAEGGFGRIYKVRDKAGNELALKETLFSDKKSINRFKREIKILKKLNHPNVISVIDSDITLEKPYFVMELANSNLDKIIKAKEIENNIQIIKDIFLQILNGMNHAHSKNIIHRDLKPGNILIVKNKDSNFIVKITDFGLGKNIKNESLDLTKTNTDLGTQHYSAPEQLNNSKDADKRADIYSLGMILNILVTGSINKNINNKHPFYKIYLKCIEREPNNRYQNIDEIIKDLNEDNIELIYKDELIITSEKDNELRTPSNFLKSVTGSFSIWVYLNPLGSGIRALENNRHIISHDTNRGLTIYPSKYLNVFSFALVPDNYEKPSKSIWRLWLSDSEGKEWQWNYPDSLEVGWCHIVLRWDHNQNIMQVLMNGKIIIDCEKFYKDYWPKEYFDYLFIGTWPHKMKFHFIETSIARVTTSTLFLDDEWITEELKVKKLLKSPNLVISKQIANSQTNFDINTKRIEIITTLDTLAFDFIQATNRFINPNDSLEDKIEKAKIFEEKAHAFNNYYLKNRIFINDLWENIDNFWNKIYKPASWFSLLVSRDNYKTNQVKIVDAWTKADKLIGDLRTHLNQIQSEFGKALAK